MATEAEIIPEPISIVKTDEESRHLTSELCDKAVEFLPGDLKQFTSSFNQPAATNECLPKPENMQVHSDKGVETKSTISEGNAEVLKGESFLISPEIAAVASKGTSEMSEHIEVDDTPIKAEETLEDEKQKAYEKGGNEVEAGTVENQVKTTVDSLQKGDIDEGTSLKTEKRVEYEVIADQDSSLLEKSGNIEEESGCSHESKQEGKRTDENAGIEFNKEVISIPEANLELQKQASTDASNPVVDSLKPNETVTELSNSNLVQEEEEVKSSIEVKDTEPKKLPVLVGKEDGTEATEPIEASGNQEASDEMKEDKEITVPFSEGNISEVESVDVLKQSQEGSLDEAEIPKESFQQQNEPEKEKPACPLNAVHEDVNTAISSENKETSTTIKEVTSITDHEKKFEGERVAETTTNTGSLSENKESKEMDNLQIEVNQNTETVAVEILKKNADDLDVADSLVGKSVEKDNEKQYERSDSQPEEQALETNVESKEKEVHSEDVSEAATTAALRLETNAMAEEKVKVNLLDSEKCSDKDKATESKQDGIQEEETHTEEKTEIETRGDISEKDVTEESRSNTEQDETQESDKEKTVIAEENSGRISSENEPQENIEYVTSKETEAVTSKANEIPSVMEVETVQDFGETTEKEDKLEDEKDDKSNEDKGTTKEEVETISKGYELETKEQPEPKDAVENIEENSKQKETEQVCESPEQIIKEECAIKNDMAKSAEEEMLKRVQEDKQEEITEVKEYEKLETNNIVEDAEKQIAEKDTNKDQSTQLTETAEEKSEEKIEDEIKAERNFEVSTSAIDKEGSCEKENEKRKSEVEVCKESETLASGTGKENPDMDGHPIAEISNSSISDETVEESVKEDESSSRKLTEEASSSNIEQTESIAETTLQTSEETAEPNDNPNLLDSAKESNEIETREIKEDPVCSSSFVTEEPKKDNEEETSVKGSIDTAGLDVASTATCTEEASIKEEEAEEKKQKIDNVIAVQKNGLSTTEQEGIGVDSADIDVKPADSISCEREIPKDEAPNAGSEDQQGTTAREIPLKEIFGDEAKEHYTVHAGEHERAPTEERKITCGTSEKDQAPYGHPETPVPQATDEMLMQKEYNPTLVGPKVDSEDTRKQRGDDEHLAEEPNVHTDQKTEKCISVSEATDVSKGEEPGELEKQSDACESKTSQEEQSSDLGLERERTDDGNSLDEATKLGEASGTCKDDEKTIQEEENLAENLGKPESLKEDTEVEKEETELLTQAHDQMPEAVNKAKNVEPELGVSEEKPKSDSANVAEDQKKEQFLEPSKSPADETSTHVQNQETESQINEELEDKLQDDDYINREQKTDEVTKAVILSEEVDKEVKKAEDSEDIKEHVTEEEDKGIKEDAETEKSLRVEELHENKVEETKGIPETSSNNISQGVETIVEDDISSHNPIPEEKQEEKLSANQLEEGTTSSALLPKEQEETVSMVEKIEEENIKEIDTPHAMISEDSSGEKKTEEISLEKEDFPDLEDVKKDETRAAQNLQVEESKDQSITSTSTLPSEDVKHETIAKVDEIEEEKVKEMELLEKERPQEPEASEDQEEKKEEQLQTSASTLPSEDEEMRNAHPVEKIEEEIQKDAEVVKHESLEDSSDRKTTEEVSLQKVEQREPKAASEEITITGQGLEKKEPEEQIQTTSSTLPSEEREHGTGVTTEEMEYDKTKEEVPAKLDVLNGEEITGEQTLSANKSEEGTTTFALLPKEQEDTVSMVGKIEEENIKEVETPDTKISEDSSNEKKPAEISLQKEEFPELEDAKKDETPASQDFQAEEPKDQSLTSSSTLPSEEVEHGTIAKADEIDEEKAKEVEMPEKESTKDSEAVMDQESAVTQASLTEESLETISPFEKLDDEKRKEVEKLENESCEDSSAGGTDEISLQKEEPIELHAIPKEETTSGQISTEEKSEEHISTSAITSEEQEHGIEKIEDEKTNKEEIIKEESPKDASDARTVEEICSQKERSIEPEAVVENETTADLIVTEKKLEEQVENPTSALPSKEEEFVSTNTSGNPDKAELLQDHNDKDEKEELQMGETLATSTLTSEEQKDERKETELQEDESSKKIPEQTREIEEASDVKTETCEKAFDSELQTNTEEAAIDEKVVKESDNARDKENQYEKTHEGNKIILNEVSKEEIIKTSLNLSNFHVIEDKEVTEISYSTSLSEESTTDSSGGDELKNEQVEDKPNEALEVIVEDRESGENETIERQIVFEDKTVRDPGEVSVARIDSAKATEKEPSVELSQAEGTKDLGESNEKTNDIQQPEETCKASNKLIPRELDPTEITDVTSSVGKEDVPIRLQDRVAESFEKAEVGDVKEVYSKAEVELGAEKTTDNLGEEKTEESVAVEDSTKATVQVTAQDVTEEKVEDKTSAAQILVEKPEEESLAPSSKFPSKEGMNGVRVKVDAEEKDLKEVETLDRDTCDTKPGAEIGLEKEENEELKAVTKQETIAVQAPTAELKEDKELAQATVSHFEDAHKEEGKGESIGDEAKETLKAPGYETQKEELLAETQKNNSNSNIEKEIIAEDKTVKDPEQASVGMEKERTVKEKIAGEADRVESTETISSIGKEHFPVEQHERALGTPDKAKVGELEPGKAQENCSEAGVDHREENKTDNSDAEVTEEGASADSAKSSLSDLLQRGEKLQVAKDVIQERELMVSKEESHAEEEETVQVKEAKTDEEQEEGQEGDEHNHKADSGSEAPVMVEAPRETDTKPHKKSHNILSGMGSKVKHSISKVKKAITGKSSHSKESKPTSPKESEK